MNLKAAAGIAAGLVLAGVVGMELAGDALEVAREDWPDGGKPQAVDCYRLTGLDKEGREYVSVVDCVAAGTKPDGRGLEVISIEPTTALTTKRDVVAFECACSSGRDCEQFLPPYRDVNFDGGWVPATNGRTLAKNRWRGAGCFRKSCGELFRNDVTSWPPECPE